MRRMTFTAATAIWLSCSVAHAQEQTATDGTRDTSLGLEEIVVTAQKRPQRISDVPMAISAYDAQFLKQIDANELGRVAQITPGLGIELQDRLLPGISLRGLTSDDTSPASEPRVAIFQDGVPITQIASAYAEIFDVDRIEVEKGPQSTLHGRSALNGGISTFQKLPTRDLSAEFKGGIGNYGYRQAQGVVNLPLTATLGLRMGALMHKRDGFVQDNITGDSYNKINAQAYRLTASFEPGTNFSYHLSGTYDVDNTNSGGSFKSSVFVPLDQLTGAANGDAQFWTPTHLGTFGDMPAQYTRRRILGLSGTANLRLNDALDLTSISGFRWYRACQAGDIDGTPTNIIAYEQCNRGRQYSEELRLNIKAPGVFEGFVGGSYFKANNDAQVDLGVDERAAALLLNGTLRRFAPTGLTNTQINAALGTRAALLKPFHLDRKAQTASIDTYDIFADGTLHLTSQLEVFAGGRLTWDRKDVTTQSTTPLGVSRLTGRGLLIASTPGGARLEGSRSSNLLTGRAGLRYVFSPVINFYAVYAIGKRPEVIDITSAGATIIVPEEKLRSIEAGIKFRLPDGTLSGDASVYHYDYSNFQTLQRIDGVLTTVNAGNASSTGFETQATWRPASWLSLFGTYSYSHARFTAGAYQGNRFRNNPDHMLAVGFNATADARVGTFSLAPLYSWKSKKFFSDDNDRTDLQVRSTAAFSDTTVDEFQKPFGLLSARLGFTPASGPWSIALVGDNLLDEKYVVDAGNTGDAFGIPTFVGGSRRTVRVDFSLNF